MMYAAIRKYRATEEPVFATQGEQEPLQLARSVDGFVGYYLVGGRDGTATAITIGQTVQTVEETTAVAPDWNVERVAHLVAGAPDVTIGEVRLQLRTTPQEQPPAMGLDMVEPTTIRG